LQDSDIPNIKKGGSVLSNEILDSPHKQACKIRLIKKNTTALWLLTLLKNYHI